jgi:hypothetical protein
MNAFGGGGRAVLLHSKTAEGAPADFFGSHGSIRPFAGSPWYHSRGFPQRGHSVAFCDVWWAGFGYMVSLPSGCLGSGCGGEEPRAVVMPSGEGLVASPAG